MRKHTLAAVLAVGLMTSNAHALFAKKVDTNIKFSKKLPKKQRKAMENDLQVLNDFSFDAQADEDTLKIMNITDLNNESAKRWLEDRVEFVMESREWSDLEKQIEVISKYHTFDNANIQPTIEKPTSKPSGKGVVVMSNLGAALYYAAKTSKMLFGLKLKTKRHGKEMITFSSPRAGLIQVGPGHFMEKFNWNQEDKKAKSNSLGRLATFFHEARHSDGNSENLGFFHAVCPDGHDFQGYNACDRNLNGPYSVGAAITKEFLKNCTDCNEAEKEKMKLSYLDSENRVIKVTKKAAPDSSPEVRMLEVELEMQEMLLGLAFTQTSKDETMKKIAEIKAKILKLAEQSGKIIEVPSEHLDANPEGRRI